MSPSGRVVVTANGGPGPNSLTIGERERSGKLNIRQIFAGRNPDDAPDQEAGAWKGVAMGLALPNDHSVYVSEGNSGMVSLFDWTSGRRRVISLNQKGFDNSYTGDLAFDPARNILYVVDQANFRVAVIDAAKRVLIASVRTGYLPFAIALSADRTKLYVCNLGMFQYRPLSAVDVQRSAATGISFPAFGFPSAEAIHGVRRPTATGETDVPGLGDPNTEQANSVSVIDVTTPASPAAQAFIRTGQPLGENSLGGSSPSAVLAAGGRVFVSNAGNDSISVIDPGTNQVEAEIPLRIPGLETLRGVVPSGLAYHEKSGWLLVAEAGINAVGVIDPRARRVLGHLPAAWFPTRIAIHQDTAYVANARGHGEGPNARGYVPYDQQGQGTLSVFPLPAEGEIAEFTAFVLHANGFDVRPAPDPPLPAAVKHVVLIVKSSRSYDEMLGGIARVSNGAVMGAPGLARFGLQGYADGRGARLSLKAVAIAPNQQAIARQWAFSDNFYADSDTAVDGHHWIAGAYPNLWSESSLIAAASDQKKDFRVAEAPGRLSFPGSDASVHPEDVSEGGTIWHHFARHGVSFYSFGEGFQLAGASDGPALEPTGVRLLTNVPMPDPLYRNTSQTYPAFNMNIPDQYRASQFIQQVEAKYGKGGEAFPQFVFLHLPNDYGAAARPADGFPYRESFIADNDYALARILEYLSGTPWWKEMAVFITEDSSQGGVDHIDANRTLLLCAGPWIKRNYVSHANTSFPGLLKTIFRLLKLPPLNLFDAAARDLSECFTSEPDYSVYKTLPPDTRVFDAAALQQIISGSSGSAVAGKTPK